MNCDAALEAMLDAEPSDLSEYGTTPLSTHLATCKRCHAVAHQLAVDTQLLAGYIVAQEAPRRMRRSLVWVPRSLVPVGLVAALLVALMRRTPDMPPIATGAASPRTAVAAPDSVMPLRSADTAPASVPRPARIRAYPVPVPVAAVRMTPTSQTALTRDEGGSAVIVEPPAGRRVAVMRTDNPKFTVVWLY